MKKIRSMISKQSIMLILFLGVFIGLSATTVYFYRKYQSIKRNLDQIQNQERETIIASIKRFMDLPTEEDPTLATVTDKEMLKEQDFFKRAENGDKVLLYPKSGKAILYRPSTGRVVEFAPLILGASEATSSMESQREQQSPQPKEVTVTIYNGTKIVGLTSSYEKVLKKLENVVVQSRKNAAKSTYTKTLVIDLNENNSDIVKSIADMINGDVVKELPEGEVKPETDILIIAAQDLP